MGDRTYLREERIVSYASKNFSWKDRKSIHSIFPGTPVNEIKKSQKLNN